MAFGSDRHVDEEPQALEALLRWYIDMGADAAVDETPTIGRDPAPPTRQVVSQTTYLPEGEDRAATSGGLIAEAQSRAAAADTLEQLAANWSTLPGCGLAKTAACMIFAAGRAGSPVMFVGAAPDSDDERQGLALAGEKGDLFDAMLAAIGLDRASVYYGSVLPWRPPGNRLPTPLELSLCLPFARRHIELARPQLIVCLGERPAHQLLGSGEPLSKLRGRWIGYEGEQISRKTLVTFALDFLLKQPLQKRRAWADWMMLASELDRLGSSTSKA